MTTPKNGVATGRQELPYQPQFEDAILPQVEDLTAEMERLLSY
jgi:hypothetical protein